MCRKNGEDISMWIVANDDTQECGELCQMRYGIQSGTKNFFIKAYICMQLYQMQVECQNVVPTVKSSIFNLYSKFEATGSVMDALHKWTPTVITPQKPDVVVTLFTENLWISLWKGWQTIGMSYDSIQWATKTLKLTSTSSALHMRSFLLPNILPLVTGIGSLHIIACLDTILFSDKAWFSLTVYINS